VRLHAAVEPRQVKFHLLHDADGARIRQKRECSADGQEVPYEHVVKGYPLRPGQYVEVTSGELEAFDPKSSRGIELEDFVTLEEIDPRFYEASYHLVPEVGSEHQYELLAEALRRSGRVGIGRLVMRHKGHLCVVRPFGRGLMLSTLYYAEEQIAQETLPELDVMGARPSEQEVDMVLRLIESQAATFEPRRYHDTHRERLMSFLERRARAQAKVTLPVGSLPASQPPSEVAERLEAFRRIEEGISALRRNGRGPARAERQAAERGSLRFRAQAAREVRRPKGEEGEAFGASPGQDESEPS
jgi:DNA end-binding protein Ku